MTPMTHSRGGSGMVLKLSEWRENCATKCFCQGLLHLRNHWHWSTVMDVIKNVLVRCQWGRCLENIGWEKTLCFPSLGWIWNLQPVAWGCNNWWCKVLCISSPIQPSHASLVCDAEYWTRNLHVCQWYTYRWLLVVGCCSYNGDMNPFWTRLLNRFFGWETTALWGGGGSIYLKS